MTTRAPERPVHSNPTPGAGVGHRTLVGLLLVGAALAPVVLRRLTHGNADSGGLVLSGAGAYAVTAAGASVALLVLGFGLLRRTSWHYPDGPGPDLRIDLLRGLAIVFVVLNHVNIPSLFQLGSQEALGPVSGVELFVVLSGVILGMVHRTQVERAGLVVVTGALLARSLKLYRTALVVVLTSFLLTLLPGVDGRVVTTFTDQGTGRVSQLYPNIERLLDYPVPGYVLRDILFLRLGPFQFHIMGLYVVLLALAPLMIVLLGKRLVLVLLVLSWMCYGLDAVRPTVVVDTQFQNPFPLLTWQLLFVHGLAAGWYRTQLLRLARSWAGKVVLALMVMAHLAFVFFTWNSPFLSNAYDARLALIPDATFTGIYDRWFERSTLQLGRVVDVGLLLVTVYALLTAYWRPLNALLGWFLVPLGQASVYVFVVHVYFALIIANVPGLDQGHVLLNTVAHAATLALLWLMARRRVLFSVVPR